MSTPRLTDSDVRRAVQILDGWTGKLTWDRFAGELAHVLGHRYTKPGLRKHARILNAWNMTKARLEQSTKQSGARSNGTAEIAHARARIQKLKAEVERLEQENRDLLERFQRWSYNAASRGMTEQQLDQAIIVPRGAK
jgi:hypothetical protein